MVEKRKKTRSTSSSVDPTTRYAMDVASGKEIAGPDIRNSCKRHLKDLESCHARGLVWDTVTAQRAIDFFAKVLKLNGGEHEGKPFNLLPWQCFIVGSVFGWQNSDGYRRFRMVYVESGIRGFGLDGVCGMMPAMTGIDVFGAAMSVDEAAAKIFENGLQSTGFLSSKNALTKEQRDRLRQNLQSFIGSKNAGKLMVLENELSYQNVTMNPEAAQLLESRSFSIEEICRWFRVPPFMVGHTTKQSSWASSLEGMNLQFLTHTLRPLLVNIEQEIGRCLLDSDDDVFAEFSVEGLLRADSAGRAAYYTSALQNGWMSRNDVRRLENMPPIEGGDIYTVQLNLTQLKNLESVNPAVQALAVRELHNHVFPDIPYEQSPLKQAA